jgi:cell division protein FtsN
MREMHKWKDKVELSLDNRQIFFLFFGLSVIGCFVFALGIMTGRRIDWEPGQEAAALGGQDSLELLEGEGDAEAHGEQFAFQQGLSESDAAAIPPTRDPEVPPRAEDEVRAEREEQAQAQEAAQQREAEAAEVEAQIDEQQAALAQATPEAARPRTATGDSRRFTLQMKAFSNPADAEKLADKLRHNGHEVRIETHDVRGRTWHRVRLGAFDTWDEALAAKTGFEQAEHVIAYVVSL